MIFALCDCMLQDQENQLKDYRINVVAGADPRKQDDCTFGGGHQNGADEGGQRMNGAIRNQAGGGGREPCGGDTKGRQRHS